MVTIKSLQECLNVSTGKILKIILLEKINLNKITYQEITSLLFKYRLKSFTKIKIRSNIKYGAIKIEINKKQYNKTYITKLTNIAYKPLYNSVINNYNGLCFICNSPDKIQIHHKDKNHSNMVEEKLVPLCKYCHFDLHLGLI